MLRRFRHLVVFVGSFLAVLLAVRLATVDRPRPFGVELRGSSAGWAMPSRPVAILTATLIGILYTLVPVGRWRQLGKWVASALVAAFALARIHLGVDAPTDALLGAVIGVAVSVAAYRLFVPNETSRLPTSGAGAPTWTWAAGVARPSARRWPTSSG